MPLRLQPQQDGSRVVALLVARVFQPIRIDFALQVAQLRDQRLQPCCCGALDQRGGVVKLVEGHKIGEAVGAEEGGGSTAMDGHVDHCQVLGSLRHDTERPGAATFGVLQRATSAEVFERLRIVIGDACRADAAHTGDVLGCLMLLRNRLGKLDGLNAVVVGRSNLFGKPMAQLLLRENCTVTIAHSRTRDLADVCRRADILVAAVGRAEMVKGDWVKPGATVIDVGITRVPHPDQPGKTRLIGDVDFAAASQTAAAITPVPGGVGPMTIACLLANTVTACCRINGLADPEGLGI